MQKKIKIIIYFVLISLLIVGLVYFIKYFGPILITDWINWLGENAV